MELVVEVKDFEHAKYCIENNIDNIIIGNQLFATRISYSFNESEINWLANNAKNTKIWIKANKFFFEHELDRLMMYLHWISSLNIDRVVFQDYAVAQINHENNFKLKLHYQPETLVTSYGQFPFYLQNNISSVGLARELTMRELEEIAKHKGQMQIMIQGFGYGFIMHSRWRLIDNFLEHYQLQQNQQAWWIKEHQRKIPNLIFEDDHGTHMLTGYVINGLSLIDKFKSLPIDYFLVDLIKLDDVDVYQLTKLINQHITKPLSPEQYENLLNLLNHHLLSKGFFDTPKSVLHLQKEKEQEHE